MSFSFVEAVSGLAALGDSIDGTGRVARRLARARADGSTVATEWSCPFCGRFAESEIESLRHIALEAHYLRRAAPDDLRALFTPVGDGPSSRRIPVKRVRLMDGRVRYRIVVDVDPELGRKRDQRTFTYDTFDEAASARAQFIDARRSAVDSARQNRLGKNLEAS